MKPGPTRLISLLGLMLLSAAPALAAKPDENAQVIASVVDPRERLKVDQYLELCDRGSGKGVYRLDTRGFVSAMSDLETAEGKVSVIVASIAPGEYELCQIHAQRGLRVFDASPGQPFPITVRPDTAVYLGQFRPVFTMKKTLGVPMPIAVRYDVSDHQARDIDLATRRGEHVMPAVGQIPH